VEGRAAVESSPELAYGATLLAAAATDKVLLYLQLGDGEILSVSAQGTTTRPLPPDDRLIANQTTSLCQPEAWKDFRSSWVTAGALPSLVLLSTDGYANSFRSDDDFLKIGQDYLEIIREQGISSLAEELPAILTEATQQGSGDDITLAILQDDLSAAGAAKVPRPLIPPGSKSALIEQLKARHSSQQHKLQELAFRVEQTRKDNRRLRNTILLLVIGAMAIVIAVFHNRIFPPSAARSPLPPTLDAASKKPGVKPVASAHKPPPDEWLLQVNDKKLTLGQDSHVPPIFIGPKAKPAEFQRDYAEVALDDNKDFILINRSTDKWEVVGTHKRISPGDNVRLGEKPVTIVFEPDIKGTLTPAAEASPAAPTDQPQ
jgi:hypothetical protein